MSIPNALPPKVTVITGYYNRVAAVDATIHSILSQTFKNIELIAFDDCSSDGTGLRLLELQDKYQDPRFKVINHERNKGFVQGMIEAIALSSGEYICVQGSGDISLPQRIERQVALLDARSDVGAVGCWYTNIVSTTGARRARKPSADKVNFDSLLTGSNVFSHGEVMMRREIYEQAGGYRAAFKYSQDIDLWLRIVRLAKLATVPEFLYERFVRFDGVSYDPRKFAQQMRYSLLARRIAKLPAHEAKKIIDILSSSGPLTLVPQSDPVLQKLYIKGALRSAIFGASSGAEALAKANIVNPLLRFGIIYFARLFNSPICSPLRKITSKFFGMVD